MGRRDDDDRETRETHSGRASGSAAKAAQQRRLFLEAIAKGLSVSSACRAAGVGRATPYRWRKGNKVFARAWDEAEQDGVDKLEDRALQLAHAGDAKLVMFLLKAKRPEKYRESVNHNHAGGFDVNLDEVRASIDRKLARVAAAGAAAGVPSKPHS